MIFNKQGRIDIDAMFNENPSLNRIMQDNIVTDDELQQQAELVESLLHEIERHFNAEDQRLIMRLMAETNVLMAINHYYELQKLQ